MSENEDIRVYDYKRLKMALEQSFPTVKVSKRRAEKVFGLKRAHFNLCVCGKIKNPGIETLLKFANLCGCEVDFFCPEVSKQAKSADSPHIPPR